LVSLLRLKMTKNHIENLSMVVIDSWLKNTTTKMMLKICRY
ncbi:hypothetical protein BV033_01796C, partial [Haemophilus influenzae]